MASSSSSSQQTTTPSISVRKYLRWLPDGDFLEPTSTLVLTSHTNHYVDIRILKPELVSSAFDPPNTKTALPVSRLDWAFAGTAESTVHTRRQSSSGVSSSSASKLKELTPLQSDPAKTPTSNGNPAMSPSAETPASQPLNHKRKQSGPSSSAASTITYRHTTWTHWVDSRHSKGTRASLGSKRPNPATSLDGTISNGDEFVDSGSLYPTERENEVLEKGRMPNPGNSGALTDYEELWRDLPLQKLPHEQGILSLVLKAENKVLGTRGLIVRIGSWCQGVIRSGNDIGVERWRFGGVPIVGGGEAGLVEGAVGGGIEDAAGRNKWERIAKIGEMSLPCQVCWEKGWQLEVGEEVVCGGLKWGVVEKVVWKE